MRLVCYSVTPQTQNYMSKLAESMEHQPASENVTREAKLKIMAAVSIVTI